MSELLLALDVGTQSARAIAFDPSGSLVAGARIPYEPYHSPRPGWAEQDPAVYWEALVAACRRLRDDGLDLAAIGAVSLTTQRSTIVLVDEAGVPLRPAIVWLDARRTEGIPPLGGLTGLGFRLARVAGTVARLRAEAEVNWLARHEPGTLERAHRILFLSGYLTRRLTGEFVDSAAAQVGYLPFDYRRHAWSGPRDWRWRALPVGRHQLPELVPATGTLGGLTAEAAAATGLRAGTPLIAAAADRACEALGAGAATPDVACVGYGTTATVSTTHRRYLETIPLIPPFPAAIPGAYNLEWQIYRGFWLVEWFRRELGHPEVALAASDGSPGAEALLDRLLEASPPGANGLLHLPTWSPGIRHPGPEARGAFVGLTDLHGRADLYRAIVEGIAYGLREGLERSERRSGIRAASLRIAGGGSRGTGIAQLTADVFGRPVVVPHVAETSALGAAIDAAAGIGLHRDAERAAAAMTRPERTVDPDPERSARYDALYRGAFLGLYDALRPTYRTIRDLTGHPP
ncbi:MAG: hypothetical protein RL338_1933 [Chloroflexota bacterium]